MANVPGIVIGAYAITAGLEGNAECAFTLVKEQGEFIPWIVAVILLWALWRYTPAPENEVVKGLIGLAVLGFLVLQFSKVNTFVQDIWGSIESMGTTKVLEDS